MQCPNPEQKATVAKMRRRMCTSAKDLSPDVIFSESSRRRCVEKLKALPALMYGENKPTKRAAVLVPLCSRNGEPHLLYTLRDPRLSSHAGQVSFPGGMSEEGESAQDTALRETCEELGIPPEQVDVWTEMSPFQGANHSVLITPKVGVIKNFQFDKLQPNLDEVSEVFTVPLKHFCTPGIHGHLHAIGFLLPVYLYEHYKIWGITALMTHVFLLNFLPEDVYKGDLLNVKYKYEDFVPSKL